MTTVINGSSPALTFPDGTTQTTAFTSTPSLTTVTTTGDATFATSSGNVGIGTSSPAYKLDISTASADATQITKAATDGYFTQYKESTTLVGYVYSSTGSTNPFRIGAGSPKPLTLETGGLERMRIDSSGNLIVKSLITSTTASAANITCDNSTGQLYRSTSSIKYKTDVQDATHGLAEVLKLRPVTYKGKNIEIDGDKVFGGLIAEEVDAIGLTEFVEYAEDDTPDALAYGQMVSLLVKAIQELNAKVEALEAK